MSVEQSPPRTQHSSHDARRASLLAFVTLAPVRSAQRAELERRIRRDTLAERAGDHRRGEPRRAARHDRGRCAERLVHPVADVRRAVAPVRAHVLQGEPRYPEPEQFVARASELGAVFNGTTHGGAGQLLPHRAVRQHDARRSRCSPRRSARRSSSRTSWSASARSSSASTTARNRIRSTR